MLGTFSKTTLSAAILAAIDPVVNTTYLQRVYDDYQGYQGFTATAVTAVIDIFSTTEDAPCLIQCSAATSTVTGTTITGRAVDPRSMPEYRWRVLDSNGNVPTNWVNNGKGTLNPVTGEYVNDYTDQVGPMAHFPIYDLIPDTYTIYLTMRCPNGSGGYITSTATQTFTTTAAFVGFDHYFMNANTGSGSNTGHDPFGSVYTGGTYDNSTGILTATGAFATAFANQIAQGSTVSPLHRNNYHYFNSDGVTRRGEYLDANRFQVVAEDRDAGIPTTGLTSVATDGPKDDYYNKADFNGDDVVYHLDFNGGSTVYEQTTARFGHKANYNHAFIIGYNYGSNDRGTLRYTGTLSTQNMVSSEMDSKIFLSGVEFDGNELAGGLETGEYHSTTETNEWRFVVDNCATVNTRSVISIRASDATKTGRPRAQFGVIGGSFHNANINEWTDHSTPPTYVDGNTFTLSGALAGEHYPVGDRIRMTGALTGTVEGTVTSNTYSEPNTTIVVSWDSGTLSNETLTLESEWLQKQHVSIFSLPDTGWVSWRGAELHGDSVREGFDHFIYNDTAQNRQAFTCIKARGIDDNYRPGYFLNGNTNAAVVGVADLFFTADNDVEGCNYYVDASSSDNTPEKPWFDSMLHLRNRAKVFKDFALYSNNHIGVFIANVFDGRVSNEGNPKFISCAYDSVSDSGANEMSIFGHDNIVLDGILTNHHNGYGVGSHKELRNNHVYRDDGTFVDTYHNTAFDSKIEYSGNTYYSSVGSVVIDMKPGSDGGLAASETTAETGGSTMSNTEAEPDYQDKANDNFLPTGYGGSAPTITTQPAATTTTSGEVAIFWAEFSQADSYSWEIDTGGGFVAVANTNSPVFFYVSEGSDVDVRVKGTNNAGTTTSSTVTMTGTPAVVAPVLSGSFDIPDGVDGDSLSLDVSALATGGDAPTAWALTGTPPTNAVISSSGVITGARVEEILASNSFGVQASNSGGSSNVLLDSDGTTITAAPASLAVSTLTYDDRSGLFTSPDVTAFDYEEDGLSMVSAHTDDLLRFRTVSTAFDGTSVTSTVTSTYDFGQNVTDVKFIDDYNKISVVGADKKVHIINLATKGTFVGATLGPVSASAVFVLGAGHGWSSDGTKIWVPDRADDRVQTYVCTTAYDPSAFSSTVNGADLSSEDGNLDTLWPVSDNEMILVNSTSGEFYQYTMTGGTTNDMTLSSSNTAVTSESNYLDGISVGGGFLTIYRSLRFRKFDF